MTPFARWRGWELVLTNKRVFLIVSSLLLLGSTLDVLSLGTLYVVGLSIQGRAVFGLSVEGASLLLVVAWAIRAVGMIVIFRAVHRLIAGEEVRWRKRLVADALRRDLAFFHLQRSGEITNASLNEARLAANGLIAAATAVQGVLTLAAILVATLWITPWVWMPLSVGVIAGVLIMRALRARSLRVGGEHMESNRLLANQLTEIPRAIREIKLFGIEARVLDDTTKSAEGSSVAYAHIMSIHQEARTTVELVFVVSVVLGASLFSAELATEANLIATLLFLAGVAGRAVPYLTRVSSASHQINANTHEMVAMAKLLRTPEPRDGSPRETSSDSERLSDWSHLEVRNVSFAYPSGTTVIEDAVLDIRKGSVVVLFGPSGGGKSTLLDLLAGFLHPTSGQVVVDGVDLGLIDRKDWFGQIGYVPQFPYVFFGTIRENLTVGRDAAEDALEAACARSGFDSVLRSLPAGYGTVVGEGGSGLSGGQKQKLAIARMLLRMPTLVLFDEPTSAMDAESRADFGRLVTELRESCGVVIASHSTELSAFGDQSFRVGAGRVAPQTVRVPAGGVPGTQPG